MAGLAPARDCGTALGPPYEEGPPRWATRLPRRRAQKDRNTVERCINKFKAWRRIATRYDKGPESHLAGLYLRGAVIWMRSLRPT